MMRVKCHVKESEEKSSLKLQEIKIRKQDFLQVF